MDCLFCKISRGDMVSDTVFEDTAVKVIKDIYPKAPVHLLVLPKTHVQSIAHLEADHADLVATLIYTAKKVAASLGLAGYKLVFNVGKEGGQAIDHLHLHLLGGWSGPEDRRADV